jgi:hypothetical protein
VIKNEQNLKDALAYIRDGINTIMFSNLVLNVLFSASLQMLWGTINTL